MNQFPLLTAILLIPLLAIFVLIALPRKAVKPIRVVAAVATTLTMQFVERIPWINDLGVNYALGVDGISLPMLLLTTLIGVSAVFSSWNTRQRSKEFFVLLLILLTGVSGTFITTDLFIFLLFYEMVVIPIYIMVLIWGSTKRVSKEYAGMKLTIYLLIGSAFMLVGIIALYLQAYPAGQRTFDMAVVELSTMMTVISV